MGPRVRCNHILFLVIFLAAFALVPSSAEDLPPITLFIPSPNMIHSDQVMDQVSTPEGDVLFGTSFGLSLYNGTWSTRHINRDNVSEGLMDEFITAVEYDQNGDLWIGYSGGIQIYNGKTYRTFRDQQLFKDPRIQDLQRWHDDMWVATGHSGIHRYHAGTWTWFQPYSPGGPDFYEIESMALDPASDTLFIATRDNGHWIVRSTTDPVVFEQVSPEFGSFAPLQKVRRDPLGGVYLYNDTTVAHYTPAGGYVPVLTAGEISVAEISINDLAAASDGKLYLATDKGIYIWENGEVYRHITRFEGLGTSEVIRTIALDAKNRVWFSSKGYVGYFPEPSTSGNALPVEMVTPATELTHQVPTAVPTATETPAVSVTGKPAPSTPQGGLAPILDPIVRALQGILEKLGIRTGTS
jgi:ligand-binding sensor domain-containing protein